MKFCYILSPYIFITRLKPKPLLHLLFLDFKLLQNKFRFQTNFFCKYQKFNLCCLLHFQKLDYKNLIACNFNAMDELHEKNGFVDSDEWLHYFLEYQQNRSISISKHGSIDASGFSQTSKVQSPFNHKQHRSTRTSKFYVHKKATNSIHKKDKKNDRMR